MVVVEAGPADTGIDDVVTVVAIVDAGTEGGTSRSSEVVVQDFPTAGREVVLRWEQSLQNFVIVEERVSQ